MSEPFSFSNSNKNHFYLGSWKKEWAQWGREWSKLINSSLLSLICGLWAAQRPMLRKEKRTRRRRVGWFDEWEEERERSLIEEERMKCSGMNFNSWNEISSAWRKKTERGTKPSTMARQANNSTNQTHALLCGVWWLCWRRAESTTQSIQSIKSLTFEWWLMSLLMERPLPLRSKPNFMNFTLFNSFRLIYLLSWIDKDRLF